MLAARRLASSSRPNFHISPAIRSFSVSPVLFNQGRTQLSRSARLRQSINNHLMTGNYHEWQQRLYSTPTRPSQAPIAAVLPNSLSDADTAASASYPSLSRVERQPIRPEFIGQLNSADLECIDIGLDSHHRAADWSDRFALWLVRALRKPSDWFFAKRYLHRAMLLETVAAVPGMVAGSVRHLRLLRRCKASSDDDWIHHLVHEAENERMHLITWLALSRPTFIDQCIIRSVQVAFTGVYTIFYLTAPRTAHRFVGYLEEEAVKSYTAFLKEIDEGRIENVAAPPLAIEYWRLAESATLRDVVLAVRADEAAHRDVNHYLAN